MGSRSSAPLGSRSGLIPITRSCWANTTDHSFYVWVWVCNRWLLIRVNDLSAFVSLFAGLSIVLRRGTIDAGAASLSFTYSLAFADNVLWFVRTWTYYDIDMNCVERAQGYMALPQENWLHQGEIQVQNLVMQ